MGCDLVSAVRSAAVPVIFRGHPAAQLRQGFCEGYRKLGAILAPELTIAKSIQQGSMPARPQRTRPVSWPLLLPSNRKITYYQRPMKQRKVTGNRPSCHTRCCDSAGRRESIIGISPVRMFVTFCFRTLIGCLSAKNR